MWTQNGVKQFKIGMALPMEPQHHFYSTIEVGLG